MAEDPTTKPPVEFIPSRIDEVSALASANAPFIFYDFAASYGFHDGIANVTLEAVRHLHIGSEPAKDRVVTAHLRMSLSAVMSLRAALDGIILLATPTPPGEAH